jgi:hypothetical protein
MVEGWKQDAISQCTLNAVRSAGGRQRQIVVVVVEAVAAVRCPG